MTIIPLLPPDLKSREIYLNSRTLPVNYMADFSLMGFIVDSYTEACDLLQSEGYWLTRHQYGSELTIEGPAQIAEINSVLSSKKIICTFSDIADTLYQA